MKEIRKSTQFKKDFKRIKNNRAKVLALFTVLGYLQRGEAIPKEYSPHELSNNLAGIMECHVGSDLLLLWIDEDANIVKLLRIGSHSEVLGL